MSLHSVNLQLTILNIYVNVDSYVFFELYLLSKFRTFVDDTGNRAGYAHVVREKSVNTVSKSAYHGRLRGEYGH